MKISIGLSLLLCLFGTANCLAAPMTVATRSVEPFVFEQGGSLTGFSIDLWREIARRNGVETRFVLKPDINDVLSAVKDGGADLGISAISITAEREREFDFSQPMFDSGLQILIPRRAHTLHVVEAIVEGLFSSSMLPLLGVVLLLILIPAHLVWLWERHHPQGMLAHREYFPGIFEACWWAASTLATQADQMPRAVLARMVAVVWMFASALFVAYFTASVTSSLTLQQLHGNINGPEDLPGKRVATIAGSTSAAYLQAHHIAASEFESLPAAVAALSRRDAEALVYDSPALLYYASHEGRGATAVVGPVFQKGNYGIIARAGSPQLKAINRALLSIKEDGTYDLLYARWFGGQGLAP